jgi:hypothetical protein
MFASDNELLRMATDAVGAPVIFVGGPGGRRWAVEVMPGQYEDTGVNSIHAAPIDYMRKQVAMWEPVRRRGDGSQAAGEDITSASIAEKIGYAGKYGDYMKAIYDDMKMDVPVSETFRRLNGAVDRPSIYQFRLRMQKAGL